MTIAPPFWSLQSALYAFLLGSDSLKGLLGDPVRVYDDPPPDAIFPYIVLGETRTQNYAGIDGALEHDLRLHIFSRYTGRSEIKTILDQIYVVLQEAEIPVTDQCLVSLRFVFADILRRTDRNIYQGIARFRAVTQPDTQPD